MKRAIIILALAAVAAAPTSPISSLAGRYSRHWQNGTIDGSKYWTDDVVEIVPVDGDHAYVRAELSFYNGHSCSIAGVAHAAGDKLVYAEKAEPYEGAGKCRLTVSTRGKALLLDDGQGTCKGYCGARGSFTNYNFLQLSSKRPITYMARLKGSSQYATAIGDWKSGKVE